MSIEQIRPLNFVMGRQEPAKEGSASGGLLPVIDGALKLGGFLYVLRFVVIMVHTSSLHVPVVEALQFQNILAGWPIGLAIWLAYRLWPWARRAVRPEAVSTTGLLILVGGFLLSAIIVRLELLVFVSGLSIYANILLFSAIFFLVNVSFLYFAYDQRRERMKPLFRASCAYSLVAFLVLAYAILAYPRMSQSIGGGRPQQVGLYLDSAELAGVLGASTGSDSKLAASPRVSLLPHGRLPPGQHGAELRAAAHRGPRRPGTGHRLAGVALQTASLVTVKLVPRARAELPDPPGVTGVIRCLRTD